MLYLKISDADGHFSSAEAIENPVYVKWQERNSLLLQCTALHAQGVLSADGSEAYQLYGKDEIPNLAHTAQVITQAEYEQVKDTDPEDESPSVPEDTSAEEVLTRAQLTAKVAELEETNAMLLGCVLEMSEAVYA